MNLQINSSFGLKTYIRISNYAVTSTRNSVIYFGGYTTEEGPIDRVAEFKNFEWTLLGNLASRRTGHRSIKMGNKIYIFGGEDVT